MSTSISGSHSAMLGVMNLLCDEHIYYGTPTRICLEGMNIRSAGGGRTANMLGRYWTFSNSSRIKNWMNYLLSGELILINLDLICTLDDCEFNMLKETQYF